jgi:YD repeat-containing protein
MKTKTIIWLLLLTSTVTLFHCSDDDHDPEDPPNEEPDKSDAKSITAFAFQALTPPVIGTVNESEKTVTLTVPPGTSRETLIPTIALSDKASVTPASGTAQDFTDPLQYTVTAEDGSQQAYTVTVSVAPYDPYECLPLVIAGVEGWGSLSLSYYDTEDNMIRDIDHRYDDGTYQYTARYFWKTEDTLTHVVYEGENGLDHYTTFDYEEDTLVEKKMYTIGNIDYVEYEYHYFFENNRIKGWTEGSGSAAYTGGVYTYDNLGNVTRFDNYSLVNGEPTLFSYELYEYDDKPNVYRIAGAAGSEWRFFTAINLSANNLKRISYYNITWEDDIGPVMQFTYDAYGRPVTRDMHLSNGQITYAYECEPGQDD